MRSIVIVAAVTGAACSTLPTRPESAAPRGDGTTLRIGLVTGAERVRVSAVGNVSIRSDGAAAVRLRPDEILTVRPDGAAMTSSEWGSARPTRVTLTPRTTGDLVMVDGRSYRGVVELFSDGSGITAVNTVGLDDYVASVVGAEMGGLPREDHAALEAQAVAARTYALKNRGRWRGIGFDLRASNSDQEYRGTRTEYPAARQAVAATSGQVLMHGGNLISAFYHSTCGASTAAPSEAFRTVRDVVYLQPVSDARPAGGYYNDISPWFDWTVTWTGAQLLSVLRETLPAQVGTDPRAVDTVRNVYVRQAGASGRAVEVRVEVSKGEIPVFGPDIRLVFVSPEGRALPSNAIEFSVTASGGAVQSLSVRGSGFGHGVGLCQWGAIGRARAGLRYESILNTYYRGATIERWH